VYFPVVVEVEALDLPHCRGGLPSRLCAWLLPLQLCVYGDLCLEELLLFEEVLYQPIPDGVIRLECGRRWWRSLLRSLLGEECMWLVWNLAYSDIMPFDLVHLRLSCLYPTLFLF
jgi:hypothetical protein